MKKALIILAAFLVLCALSAFVLFVMYKRGSLQEAVVNKVGESLHATQGDRNFLADALGFDRPRTYLILFLNNTEMRPGGGFIGAYAVIRITRGVPEVIKVEGTEIIDNLAPKSLVSPPPAPIAKYLKVDKLYLRDSNWWPDFASSSVVGLDLYRREGGIEADEIDGVIGFTPTVIEELIKLTGPFTVNGKVFTSENFTETVEYEVEYAYAHQGISFDNRKKLLGDLTKHVLYEVGKDAFLHFDRYLALAERMFKEKQIAFYSPDSEEQEYLRGRGWTGEMSTTTHDYILWADANLAALKTDAAMERSLRYSITPSSTGYVGTVTMHYNHTGMFDWRTSRYLTYARLYVPLGSKLIGGKGAMVAPRSKEVGVIDQGVEHGRQWFGAYTVVEPGKTGELSFRFWLAPHVAHMIRSGNYELFVQKQMGITDASLTLGLGFDTNLKAAYPGERQEKHGDARYEFETEFASDREFWVELER